MSRAGGERRPADRLRDRRARDRQDDADRALPRGGGARRQAAHRPGAMRRDPWGWRGLSAPSRSHDRFVPRARRAGDHSPAPASRADMAHPDAIAHEPLGAESAPAPNVRPHARADAARAGGGRRGHGRGRSLAPLARGSAVERSADDRMAELPRPASRAGARPGPRVVPAVRGARRTSARCGQGRDEAARTLPRDRGVTARRGGSRRVPGAPLPRRARTRRPGRDDPRAHRGQSAVRRQRGRRPRAARRSRGARRALGASGTAPVSTQSRSPKTFIG